MADSAAILCTKCGSASTSANCAKCGGACARVCGNCGTRNSLAKNYCDQCGTPIGKTGADAAPPPRRPEEAASGIPSTVVFHATTAAAAQPSIEKVAVPALKPHQPRSTPRQIPPIAAKLVVSAIATILILGGAFAALSWRAGHDPSIAASNAATSYLTALSNHDHASAYALLSAASKRAATLEEFRAATNQQASTSWSDLKLETINADAAALQYAVKPGPNRWIRLRHDNGQWVVLNNLNTVISARKALLAANIPAAQKEASAAIEIDPRDPTARALQCEIAFGLSSAEDTRRECGVALDLARNYPGELLPQVEYRLNEIMADVHKSALNLPMVALDYYAKMLEFKGVPDAELCRILMARADTYVAMSRPGEALTDLNRAAQHCRRESDKAKIDDLRRKLGAPTDY